MFESLVPEWCYLGRLWTREYVEPCWRRHSNRGWLWGFRASFPLLCTTEAWATSFFFPRPCLPVADLPPPSWMLVLYNNQLKQTFFLVDFHHGILSQQQTCNSTLVWVILISLSIFDNIWDGRLNYVNVFCMYWDALSSKSKSYWKGSLPKSSASSYLSFFFFAKFSRSNHLSVNNKYEAYTLH